MTVNQARRNTWLGVLPRVLAAVLVVATAEGQPAPTTPPAPDAPAGVDAPADYIIGPEDVLQIVFWRDAELSSEVVVRPDGMISLPLLNDVQASGLTPEQLRARVQADAQRYVQDPNVTVVVRQINSRKVFITGQVRTPGPYPLTSSTSVLQLIATAGGLLEFAKEKDIVVMRTENGQTRSLKFNYRDVSKGKNLQQNIDLKPGDTVIVP